MAVVSTAKFNELSTQITDSGNEIGLRILLLERNDQHAQLMLTALRSASFATEFISTQADLMIRLQQGYYHLLIVNPAVTEISADALIVGLRQQGLATEVLVIAEATDTALAVAAVRAGAIDYLSRPVNLVRLLEVVKTVLSRGLGPGNLQEITPPPGYRIFKTIATGDASTVLLVVREKDRQNYAMKVLVRVESVGGADLGQVKRFFREAKILASIDHPNVVKLIEYGFSEEGIPFIIMEYVEGKPLTEHLRDDQFDFLRRLIVAEQLAKALAVVHERGVLHRDIRPCNVLVTPRYVAKLADFGLAGIADSTLTMAREILGISAYLAPEAWRDPAAVDERSDLFSLGVLYYELFTRRRPFSGGNPVQLREAICTGRPPAPRKVNPEISTPLEDLLARMLAKEPGQRPAQAAEVIAALLTCHETGGVGRLLGLFRPGKSVWQ